MAKSFGVCRGGWGGFEAAWGGCARFVRGRAAGEGVLGAVVGRFPQLSKWREKLFWRMHTCSVNRKYHSWKDNLRGCSRRSGACSNGLAARTMLAHTGHHA